MLTYSIRTVPSHSLDTAWFLSPFLLLLKLLLLYRSHPFEKRKTGMFSKILRHASFFLDLDTSHNLHQELIPSEHCKLPSLTGHSNHPCRRFRTKFSIICMLSTYREIASLYCLLCLVTYFKPWWSISITRHRYC